MCNPKHDILILHRQILHRFIRKTLTISIKQLSHHVTQMSEYDCSVNKLGCSCGFESK